MGLGSCTARVLPDPNLPKVIPENRKIVLPGRETLSGFVFLYKKFYKSFSVFQLRFFGEWNTIYVNNFKRTNFNIFPIHLHLVLFLAYILEHFTHNWFIKIKKNHHNSLTKYQCSICFTNLIQMNRHSFSTYTKDTKTI